MEKFTRQMNSDRTTIFKKSKIHVLSFLKITLTILYAHRECSFFSFAYTVSEMIKIGFIKKADITIDIKRVSE